MTINSWLHYLSLLGVVVVVVVVVGLHARGEGVVGVLLTVLWMVLGELGHNI